jgi:glycosyltransferase involved in cell wall biosynthesis
VIYYDRVSDKDKLDLLNACDLFVLPSVGESFGIVYIEAWAVGKAVVGAKSGAVASVISDGVDGLLVAPHDASDAAAKILQLYQDTEQRESLAAAGHQKVQTRYSMQRVTDIVEASYLRTIRGYSNARRQRRGAW